MPPRLHLEPPSCYSHAIARWCKPLPYLRLAPWPDSTVGPWGSTDPLINARAIAREIRSGNTAMHLGWCEPLIVDPHLDEKFGTTGYPRGPSNTELVMGIIGNSLSPGTLIGQLEPFARVLRESSVMDAIDLIYADAETIPNSDPSSQRVFPGVWSLLTMVTPGLDNRERDRVVRLAVYTAIRKALEVCGFNPDALACWQCADRATGWATNAESTPPLGVKTPRPHMAYTTGDNESTSRMEAELQGGNGPARAVVHLSSGVDPKTNAERLAICAAAGVADVVLFVETLKSLDGQVQVFSSIAGAP